MEKHAQFNLWSVPLLTGRRKVLEAGAKQLLEKALLYGSDLTVLRATLRTGPPALRRRRSSRPDATRVSPGSALDAASAF